MMKDECRAWNSSIVLRSAFLTAQFLIVSYDIPSNRRRYKVMKTLEGFRHTRAVQRI